LLPSEPILKCEAIVRSTTISLLIGNWEDWRPGQQWLHRTKSSLCGRCSCLWRHVRRQPIWRNQHWLNPSIRSITHPPSIHLHNSSKPRRRTRLKVNCIRRWKLHAENWGSLFSDRRFPNG